MVSGFDKRGINNANVWEHGNIGQFWKGTREQRPPPRWETLKDDYTILRPPCWCTQFLDFIYRMVFELFFFYCVTVQAKNLNQLIVFEFSRRREKK